MVASHVVLVSGRSPARLDMAGVKYSSFKFYAIIKSFRSEILICRELFYCISLPFGGNSALTHTQLLSPPEDTSWFVTQLPLTAPFTTLWLKVPLIAKCYFFNITHVLIILILKYGCDELKYKAEDE